MVLILALSLLLSACQSNPTSSPTPPPKAGTFPVDPLFAEYYQELGGEGLLGPVISALFNHNGLKCQYTVMVLMCQNPEGTGLARFHLESLGALIGIHDTPAISAQPESARVVDGYTIYPAFDKVISSLRGADVVGKPLSNVRYNYELQRVEQYFENMGFYYRFDDPSGKVNLMPYGWYYCGRTCHYELLDDRSFNPVKQALDTPFAAGLEHMGGLKDFGEPVTQPYMAADGNLEQVYENIVVYGAQNTPSIIHLRHLALQLDMITTPPGPKKYGLNENMVFYATQGADGFHVPVVFDKFISNHGGMETAGNPIAGVMYYEKDVPRQCFINYCLDFHPAAAETLQVRMVPLGLEYLKKFAPSNVVPTPQPKLNLVLTASEQAPQITNQEKQIINVTVEEAGTQALAVNALTEMTLTMPDATKINQSLEPTDTHGRTSVTIPAMPSLANGSMIVYQVCIKDTEPTCVYGSYLIWNNRP